MEFEILYAIQRMHRDWLDALMVFVSTLGNGGMIWILTGVAMLLFKRSRKCGFLLLISMAVSFLLGNLAIKNLVQRARPCNIDGTVPLLIPHPSEYSFPSGHTLHSFTAATMIFLHNKKAGALAFLLASLIAFSRMYLFVHFPTDILGGMILGALTAAAVFYLSLRLTEKKGRKLPGKGPKQI